jgi:hypothetical protein
MKNEVILVGVYVDDLPIVSTQVELVSKLFEDLEELRLKHLGPVSRFLGMNIAKTEDGGSITTDRSRPDDQGATQKHKDGGVQWHDDPDR